MGSDDDDVNAAIKSPSVFAGVAGDGVELRIPCSRKAFWTDTFASKKESDDLGCASRGEFPVGLELRRMDGNVISVTFDAEITSDRRKNRADAVKSSHGIGTQSRRSAIEKSDFAKTQ